MTRFQIVLWCGFISITGVAHQLDAQNVTGSTSIDVVQATNTLVVTCETDVDDGDYKPSVQCALYDASGSKVASQGYTPSYNAPYAEVVLTYVGKPGVTYTAIGSHIAICNITDLPQGGGPVYYDDPYNFEYFSQENETYLNYYEWQGPGPDTESRSKNIKTGNTKAAGTIGKPQCFAVLGYRPATMGQNHSFWWIEDSKGTQYIVDGGPTCLVGTQCYLDGWLSEGTAGIAPGYPADNSGDAQAYNSGISSDACPKVDKLEAYARAWPQMSTLYVLYGPNSNTFAHDCSNAGGFPAPKPPNAIGW
jgi:hypothetical protein